MIVADPIPMLVDVARRVVADGHRCAAPASCSCVVPDAEAALAAYDGTRNVGGLHPAVMPGQLTAYVLPHERHAIAFLATFRSKRTIDAYKTGLRFFFAFCDRYGADPLDADRATIDMFMHSLEMEGKAPRTRSLRLTTLSSFFKYLLDEEVITRDPCRKVERPKFSKKSPTAWLKQGQLFDLVTAAEELGPHPHALVSLLAFNGLRIAEACSLDVGSFGHHGFWPVITFVRKGGDTAENTLSPPTEAAVRAAIADRTSGPLLLTRYETRMNQRSAQRILDKCEPAIRGPHGRITPHSLRHSAATVALNNGAAPDQVCHDFGWSSPAMLGIYGRGKDNPARSTTNLIASTVLAVG